MENISIIITDQPLVVTGYGAVAVSPEMAFAAIVFIAVICSYVGYKALIWILGSDASLQVENRKE